MVVLVLGGNGYLGSKIIHTLVNASDINEVVFTKRPSSDLSRLTDLIGTQRVRAIPANVDAIETAMQYTHFDLVMNMACSYGRKSSLYSNVIEANIDFPLAVALFDSCKWVRLLSLTLIVIMIPNSGYYYSIYLIPIVIYFLNENKHSNSDIIPLFAFLLIFNPVQTPLTKYSIDYHLGFALLLLFVMMRFLLQLSQKRAKDIGRIRSGI